MKPLRLALCFAALLLVGLLAGCGGAGGSTSGSSGTGGTTPPPPPQLAITTVSLPLALVGSPYSAQLTAINGSGALTWSAVLSTSSVMPAGLNINSSGLLSGTPTSLTCGPALTVTVIDSSNPVQTSSATFVPDVAGIWVILGSGQVGVNYNRAIQFQCATSPVSWSLVSGTLPAGLQMQPFPGSSFQLNFKGTPTLAGAYNFNVQAQDGSGRTSEQSASIDIVPPALVITDNVMQVGAVSLAFDHVLTTTGGTPTYSFKVSTGSIAPGLLVNASTGEITGKPTSAGLYQFNIQVTDSTTPTPFTFGKPYTLLVTPAPIPPRNDALAAATPIFPGTYAVSLSPYTDAAGNAAPDQDYYSLVVNGGDKYSIGVTANFGPQEFGGATGLVIAPTDAALEILDSTGKRLATCNDPVADSATTSDPYLKGSANFTDPCVDHGGDGVTGQSRLVAQFSPGASRTVYIHVFDFEGRARPDFIYMLGVTKE